VRRHSQSGTCLVTCSFADQPFVVEIRDWGVGIVHENGDGFGLVGMRERAAGIGGRMEVASMPGRGTTILLFGP
jgi:signal transduction histidine kinase